MPARVARPRKDDGAPSRGLRCPRCGAALEIDRRRLALAAFEPRPGDAFDAEVSRLLDQVVAATEEQKG